MRQSYAGNVNNQICTLPDWALPITAAYFPAVSSRPGIGDRVAAQFFLAEDGALSFSTYEASYLQIGGFCYPVAG